MGSEIGSLCAGSDGVGFASSRTLTSSAGVGGQGSETVAEGLRCRSSSQGGFWTVVGSSQPVWASTVGSLSWVGAGGGVGSRGGSSGAVGTGRGAAGWETFETGAVDGLSGGL
jgi:hypothetical protein